MRIFDRPPPTVSSGYFFQDQVSLDDLEQLLPPVAWSPLERLWLFRPGSPQAQLHAPPPSVNMDPASSTPTYQLNGWLCQRTEDPHLFDRKPCCHKLIGRKDGNFCRRHVRTQPGSLNEAGGFSGFDHPLHRDLTISPDHLQLELA